MSAKCYLKDKMEMSNPKLLGSQSLPFPFWRDP